MNMFVIILIMWLILSPVQSCWVRKHSQDDSTECVAALRPNLVHIENQYQGFLGAVRRLNEISQQRTKTVDFLGQEAVIYTTEYLEEIKDSKFKGVLPTKYSTIVANCLDNSLGPVSFTRNRKMELFNFLKQNQLTKFTFSVKAVNENLLVFSRNFHPTAYGQYFATEMSTAQKRGGIAFATLEEGSTPGQEKVTLVEDTFANNYFPIICTNIDETTRQYLHLTNSIESFLVNHNNFSRECSLFETLTDRVRTLRKGDSLPICTGSLINVLNLEFKELSENVNFNSVSNKVQDFVKNLRQLKVNLELSMVKLNESLGLMDSTFPPEIDTWSYFNWLFSVIQNNYRIELVVTSIITSILCCCFCGIFRLCDLLMFIISNLMKLLWYGISFLILVPVVKIVNTIRERMSNWHDDGDGTQESNRRLHHSLVNFESRSRRPNGNLISRSDQDRVQFILPTLRELDIYDRNRNRGPQITEAV